MRALKAHSGKYQIVAGRPLPDELLQERPDDVEAGDDDCAIDAYCRGERCVPLDRKSVV